MKRFHVHVSVPDLAASIRFYSTLFGAEPAVVKGDYAKWMLDDPRVNFAISKRGGKTGLNHLGLQTDSDAELESLSAQLQRADLAVAAEKETSCCYARSNKYWVTDPTGIAWETFHTLGEVPTFNGEAEAAPKTAAASCCTPAAKVESRIPVKAACCS
ncbi:MAG TPA: ArsI/CadI family heavy metal resistance metalloenzyme [Burkholderiaceae bacterium]|nr:ArsI/CadI family heavy metal resistance metalloenzyme [Burkholderiaceae bacterium]HQR70068.1 ArsI/CadI family heavy metal resistance metalloenzyme [Burkholderiaceae bacterium]